MECIHKAMNLQILIFTSIVLLSCSNDRISNVTEKDNEQTTNVHEDTSPFLTYLVNPKEADLQLFWKDDAGEKIKSFAMLKSYLSEHNKKLLFAMNGGMYTKNRDPQGLYIEKGKILKKANRVQKAYGNFYMQPNGVFCIDTHYKASVVQTKNMKLDGSISYATQSGPMLVIDSQMHPDFTYKSSHVNIRNGVGILPNGIILFAMSKQEINFYDFAQFFLSKGCKNALYLDGFVSRCYLPEKNWVQMEGEFGVLIGVSKRF